MEFTTNFGHGTSNKCNLCGKFICSSTNPCLCDRNLRKEVSVPRKNNHPTVKPISLMEYLIKLVTEKGAVVLDPFVGSGTTLIACQLLKRRYIGIEKEPEYIKITKARLKFWKKPKEIREIEIRKYEIINKVKEDKEQSCLF